MKGVFISYRREDSAGWTGRIYDRAVERLGSERVFVDVDDVPIGSDFSQVIQETLARVDAMVVVIGRHWLSAADHEERRRLDDPADYVRREIAAGLAKEALVVPVLVDGAPMPADRDLPPDLKPLAYRNAVVISDLRFSHDVNRLIDALEEFISEPDEPGAVAVPEVDGAEESAPGAPAPRPAWFRPASWVAGSIALAVVAVIAVIALSGGSDTESAATEVAPSSVPAVGGSEDPATTEAPATTTTVPPTTGTTAAPTTTTPAQPLPAALDATVLLDVDLDLGTRHWNGNFTASLSDGVALFEDGCAQRAGPMAGDTVAFLAQIGDTAIPSFYIHDGDYGTDPTPPRYLIQVKQVGISSTDTGTGLVFPFAIENGPRVPIDPQELWPLDLDRWYYFLVGREGTTFNIGVVSADGEGPDYSTSIDLVDGWDDAEWRGGICNGPGVVLFDRFLELQPARGS